MTFALKGYEIGLIIGGIILFAALCALAVIFVLKSNNKNKYFVKVDNLLTGIEIANKSQLDAYLLRLKNIANNNDAYVDIYNQINAQYETLMSVERDKIIARHRGLKERIASESKVKKGLIEQIKSFENAINQYKKEVKRIQTDLEGYFKVGDQLRIRLTTLQDKFQQINVQTNKYSEAISICKKELEGYLSDIEVYFDLFDDNLSGAKYAEAEKNLDNIEKRILNVYGHIETIAQYCKMVEVVIPNQLEDLIKKNDRLQEEGYVVAHSKVFEFVENTKQILEGCKSDFKHLSFSNFEEISYEIQEKFAEIHAHLDQEVISKNELEIKYKAVSDKVRHAETEFIKTKRQFATMLDYYMIPEAYRVRFATFEHNATSLTGQKIEYDGLLFLQNNHPASFMLSKVDALDKACDVVLDDISFFVRYFRNIKEFVETTYRQVNELSVMIAISLGNIRKNKCKAIYEKYVNEANEILSSLKTVSQLLLKKPIEIEVLDKKFSTIVSNANQLNTSMNNDLENYILVSKCIVYANPLRSQFAEVDKTLDEIDALFVEGQYQKAQAKLNYILNSYHPAAFDLFKGK